MAHQLTLNSTALDELKALAQALPEAKTLQESKSVTPTTSAQTVTPDSGYDGLAKVTVGAMPTATLATPTIEVSSSGVITAKVTQSGSGYIASGANKSATKNLTVQAAKTITPTKSAQTAVASGRYTTGAVTVAAIPAAYQDVTDATATAEHIRKGYTAYAKDGKITGSMKEYGAVDNVIDGLNTASTILYGGYVDVSMTRTDGTVNNEAKKQYEMICQLAEKLGVDLDLPVSSPSSNTITFDGDVTGKEVIGDPSSFGFVRVSSYVPARADFAQGITVTIASITNYGTPEYETVDLDAESCLSSYDESMAVSNNQTASFDAFVVVYDPIVATPGIYVSRTSVTLETNLTVFTSSLTIHACAAIPGIYATDSISWDGDLGGRTAFHVDPITYFAKVSSKVPTIEDFANGCTITVNYGGQAISVPISAEQAAMFFETAGDGDLVSFDELLIISRRGGTEDGFPEEGIYSAWAVIGEVGGNLATLHMTGLTIPGYDFGVDAISLSNAASDTYVFDGDPNGKETIPLDEGYLIKISNEAPTPEQLQGDIQIDLLIDGVTPYSFVITKDQYAEEYDPNGLTYLSFAYVVATEYTEEGITFEKGVYLAYDPSLYFLLKSIKFSGCNIFVGSSSLLQYNTTLIQKLLSADISAGGSYPPAESATF